MDKNLENRIKKLEQWKEDRTRQQIVFPLDYQSQNILNKYYLSVIANLFNTSVSGQQFRKILVQQDSKVNLISVASQFMTYTANAAADTLTLGADLITGQQGTLSDDQFVVLYTPTPGTPPGGLDNAGGYFVVGSTGSVIQLATVPGGAALNITSAGTGTQYISAD